MLIRWTHGPSYRGRALHLLTAMCATPGVVPNMEEFSGIKQMWGTEEDVTAKLIIRGGKMRFLMRWEKKTWGPIKLSTWLEAPQKGIL